MFDPPASIYIDHMASQTPAKPPEQKLQLDWMYLFHFFVIIVSRKNSQRIGIVFMIVCAM